MSQSEPEIETMIESQIEQLEKDLQRDNKVPEFYDLDLDPKVSHEKSCVLAKSKNKSIKL